MGESAIAAACAGVGIEYAFTGLSAAARVAPFVRYQRADVYVNGPLEPVVGALKMHGCEIAFINGVDQELTGEHPEGGMDRVISHRRRP